jgi:superfamily I DNA/RNA helicase
MPEDDVDVLSINRGTVTAPAGCGKTHLIAKALTRHGDSKPILLLTHTNAGVVALRGRLDRANVPAKAYRLCTIDGWAMRLISTFPRRSGHNPELLALASPANDYPNIRETAANLLKIPLILDEAINIDEEGLRTHEFDELLHERPQSRLRHSWHQLVVQAALPEQGVDAPFGGACFEMFVEA